MISFPIPRTALGRARQTSLSITRGCLAEVHKGSRSIGVSGARFGRTQPVDLPNGAEEIRTFNLEFEWAVGDDFMLLGLCRLAFRPVCNSLARLSVAFECLFFPAPAQPTRHSFFR